MALATSSELTIDQLQQLANDPAQTLQHLTAVVLCLSSSDEDRVNWAGEALENCGTPAIDQLSSIAELLSHSDALVATWACKLIARLGACGAPMMERLTQVLSRHTDLLVREEAARALGTLANSRDAQGCTAAELSPAARAALAQAATEGGPRLKRLASAALGR